MVSRGFSHRQLEEPFRIDGSSKWRSLSSSITLACFAFHVVAVSGGEGGGGGGGESCTSEVEEDVDGRGKRCWPPPSDQGSCGWSSEGGWGDNADGEWDKDGWVKEWEDLQAAAMKRQEGMRFILLQLNPHMGFSNRVFALASTMLLCLALQDTGMVVAWPDDGKRKIKHPNGEVAGMPAMHELIFPGSIHLVEEVGESFFHDEAEWGSVDDTSQQLREILAEGHFRMAYPQRVVGLYSVVGAFLGGNIAGNDEWSAEVLRHRGVTFSQVLRYLVQPSERVRRSFQERLGVGEWRRGDSRTAAHLRSFLMTPQEMHVALQCASQVSRLDSAIAVASDSVTGVNLAMSQLSEGGIGVGKGGSGGLTLLDTSPGRAGGDEVASGVATLLDISRATHLVGTANSTFFLLAAALSSCEQNASASFWVVRKHLCVNVECDLRGKCAAKMAWDSSIGEYIDDFDAASYEASLL